MDKDIEKQLLPNEIIEYILNAFNLFSFATLISSRKLESSEKVQVKFYIF